MIGNKKKMPSGETRRDETTTRDVINKLQLTMGRSDDDSNGAKVERRQKQVIGNGQVEKCLPDDLVVAVRRWTRFKSGEIHLQ